MAKNQRAPKTSKVDSTVEGTGPVTLVDENPAPVTPELTLPTETPTPQVESSEPAPAKKAKEAKPLSRAQTISAEITAFLAAGGHIETVKRGSTGETGEKAPKPPKEPKAPKGVLLAREAVGKAEAEPTVENIVTAFKAIKSFLSHVWFQVWIQEGDVLRQRLLALPLPPAPVEGSTTDQAETAE